MKYLEKKGVILYYTAGMKYGYQRADNATLEKISKRFQIYGELLHAEVCKIGHINETYTASYDQGGTHVRYIHQCINTEVFKNPDHVMENISRITKHIRDNLRKRNIGDVTRRTLVVVPTREGSLYYRADDGRCWRTFFFIEGAQSFDAVQNEKQAEEAGRAFGEFQELLSNLGGKRLHETIPFFHDTRRRLEKFEKVVIEDRYERTRFAPQEIRAILKHRDLAEVIPNALADGSIPERVVHNDTKFNNVMMDQKTGKAICVVDLDTVMPGSVLYDFGDMVRTTTSPTMEDEQDLSKVYVREKIFQALARGYYNSTKSFLTPNEKKLLVFSGKLMTYMVALRFLTDYLEGDVYFQVHRANHNLDRCRTQLKLLKSLENKEAVLSKFVDSLQ